VRKNNIWLRASLAIVIASWCSAVLQAGDSEGLWLASISVPDADAAVSAVKANGGKVIEPPEDLPGRGRY